MNHRNTLDPNTYAVGSAAPEDGWYVCVPCGEKRHFKKGAQFTSCLRCLGKEKSFFKKGLELWESILYES